MDQDKDCLYCQTTFTPHPRLGPRQITCGRDECKRKHQHVCRKRWEQQYPKIILQKRQDWIKNNPSYWKDYRRDHPESTERNRIQARSRKRLRKGGLQTKIDILQPLELQMKPWILARFANQNRSLFPLLHAMRPPHDVAITAHGGSP